MTRTHLTNALVLALGIALMLWVMAGDAADIAAGRM